MATNPKFSTAAVNAAANAMTALLNNGVLRLYTGGQPTSANAAVSAANTLLASLTFAATAFTAAVNGIASANAISDETSAPATGSALWFRCWSQGAISAVWDGTVATTGGTADLLLNSIQITTGADVAVTALTLTVNAG